METTTTSVLVKRYTQPQPEPYYQKYELHFADDMTVLDGLMKLKDHTDGSLSFRWSCRMGICGSCAMMVNGKPVLTCQTYLCNVAKPGKELKIEPLRNFPVIKDLIVDIEDAFEKMRLTKPYLKRLEEKAIEDGEYKQTPQERKKLDQTSQCIKCMICYSACPVYSQDKKFMGPAAGALAYRYVNDSREGKEHNKERMDQLTSETGITGCSFVGECSAVCPKRVDPAQALQRLKVMGALHTAKSVVAGLASKIQAKPTHESK